MSRPKRTREEEIQHLKKKLLKLEAQETSISITGEYKDRASTTLQSRKDSDNDIPSIALETPVQIRSPSAPRETPATSKPRTSLDETAEHIPKNNPRATFDDVGFNEHTSKKDIRSNLNTLTAPSTKTEPPASRNALETQSSMTESRVPPGNRNTMETHSSRNDQWKNCNNLTHSLKSEHLNDMEVSSGVEPQASSIAMGAHSSTAVKPQANLDMKHSMKNSGASLDTSEPNISTDKPRASSVSSDYYNIALDQYEALLQSLGDDQISWEEHNIHPSLAQKWGTILRQGLSSDDREKLKMKYAFPENCKLLKAPILNEEVSAVVENSARYRDKNIEDRQNKLGLGIAALGRAMTVILGKGDNHEAMNHIKHGCRLLLDLHYADTDTRRYLFKKDLSRSNVFRNLRIFDFERDGTLFGTKVAKLVKKQGIPTTPMHPRPSSSNYGDPGPSNRARNSTDENIRDGEPPRYRHI